MHDYIADYVALERRNIWPHAGGRLDQDPRFLIAVDILDGEKSALGKVDREIAKATAAPERSMVDAQGRLRVLR